MPHTMDSLDTEQRIGIRAAYITGHFNREEALIRIQNGGFSQLTRDEAIYVLSQPITPALVRELTGREITAEQIAARLVEAIA